MKLIATLIATFIFISAASAEVRNLPAGQTIGDGAKGRLFAKWFGNVGDEAVNSVTMRLRKTKGDKDAYVNLRFNDGPTLENNKREYLTDNSSKTVVWRANGERAAGRQLVLIAYNAEVIVESVTVDIQGRGPNKPTLGNRPTLPPGGGSQNVGNYDAAYQNCRRMYRIGYPRVEIGRLSPSGNMFSGDQRASGSIFGQCVQEAGYFEYGQIKEKINFPMSDRYERMNFSIKVRSNRNGEIRVYTTDGQEAVVSVD